MASERWLRQKQSLKDRGLNWKVPFDEKGNQVHYPCATMQMVDGRLKTISAKRSYEWLENYEFEDTLQIQTITRGRGAVTIHLCSTSTSATFTMFFRDFLDLLKLCYIDHGQVHSKWTFIKRGDYYGVKVL